MAPLLAVLLLACRQHDAREEKTGPTPDTGEACAEATWYGDGDGDGFGDAATYACEAPPGHVAEGGDCDDADPLVYPGAVEWCDGADQDCDGEVDEDAIDVEDLYADADADGYGDATRGARVCPGAGWVATADDCDDTNAAVYPGADEVADDGVDGDCDGRDDDDEDGDGWAAGDDCDDTDATIHPGATETCDEIDDDCDGEAPSEGGDCSLCDAVVPVDAPDIQSAIDAAPDGSIICVEPGTYTENVDFGGAEVTLLGTGGAERTIIDGGNDGWDGIGPAVSIISGEGPGAVLRGFTLTRGLGWEGGGGLAVVDASPTVEDLIVSGNRTGNFADGGGVYVSGGSPTFRRLSISGNGANTPYCGALYGQGGGLALVETDAILEDVHVESNSAGQGGGGVYVEGGAPVFVRLAVVGNSANGIRVVGGSPSFTALRVTDNAWGWFFYPSGTGGGLDIRGGASVSLTNAAIADNDDQACGGGIEVADGDAALTNVVLSGNTSPGLCVASGTVTAAYSDLYDGVSGMSDPTGSGGNVAVDPLFADEACRLDAASPLLDAGDPTILDTDGSRSDIGAWGGPEGAGWSR